MAETKKPQLEEPGTSANDGAPVGKKTKQDPKDRKAHGGSVGTGGATLGRPGGAGGR